MIIRMLAPLAGHKSLAILALGLVLVALSKAHGAPSEPTDLADQVKVSDDQSKSNETSTEEESSGRNLRLSPGVSYQLECCRQLEIIKKSQQPVVPLVSWSRNKGYLPKQAIVKPAIRDNTYGYNPDNFGEVLELSKSNVKVQNSYSYGDKVYPKSAPYKTILDVKSAKKDYLPIDGPVFVPELHVGLDPPEFLAIKNIKPVKKKKLEKTLKKIEAAEKAIEPPESEDKLNLIRLKSQLALAKGLLERPGASKKYKEILIEEPKEEDPKPEEILADKLKEKLDKTIDIIDKKIAEKDKKIPLGSKYPKEVTAEGPKEKPKEDIKELVPGLDELKEKIDSILNFGKVAEEPKGEISGETKVDPIEEVKKVIPGEAPKEVAKEIPIEAPKEEVKEELKVEGVTAKPAVESAAKTEIPLLGDIQKLVKLPEDLLAGKKLEPEKLLADGLNKFVGQLTGGAKL